MGKVLIIKVLFIKRKHCWLVPNISKSNNNQLYIIITLKVSFYGFELLELADVTS